MTELAVSPAVLRKLGRVPDRQLALLAKVSPTTIRRRRNALKLPPAPIEAEWDRRDDALCALRVYQTITTRALSRMLIVSKRTALRLLRDLEREGLVGKCSHTVWALQGASQES